VCHPKIKERLRTAVPQVEKTKTCSQPVLLPEKEKTVIGIMDATPKKNKMVSGALDFNKIQQNKDAAKRQHSVSLQQ
jgi:hypothetical protein